MDSIDPWQSMVTMYKLDETETALLRPLLAHLAEIPAPMDRARQVARVIQFFGAWTAGMVSTDEWMALQMEVVAKAIQIATQK